MIDMNTMEETKIEELLHIKTTGRDDTRANSYNYPYEPTDYCVLERLVSSGLIGKKNKVTFVNENAVDFIVPETADRFFFFNPFSAEVLGSVLKKIMESAYESEREMLLFFFSFG